MWALVFVGVSFGFLLGASWASLNPVRARLESHVRRRIHILGRLRQDLARDGLTTHGPDCARLELEVLADAFGLAATSKPQFPILLDDRR